MKDQVLNESLVIGGLSLGILAWYSVDTAEDWWQDLKNWWAHLDLSLHLT